VGGGGGGGGTLTHKERKTRISLTNKEVEKAFCERVEAGRRAVAVGLTATGRSASDQYKLH